MGSYTDSYTLQGTVGDVAGGTADVTIRLAYTGDEKSIFFSGKFDVAGDTVQGTWKFSDQRLGGDFVFKRSLQFLRFRSAPELIRKSPALVRWKFALDAVHNHVKKGRWSRSYFLDRFQDRKRYIEVATVRSHQNHAINSANYAGLTGLHQHLSPSDAQFYASIARHELQQIPVPVHG